ncbi:MAG: alpha/beta hydrolase [Gemmatimonadetes bacterium]|nr:alpha/beta hydrolase [Gemmatimonadota bacterium]
MPRRLLAALLLLPAALPAQGAKLEARAYALLGTAGDTIGVERWVALGGAIRAEQRRPGGDAPLRLRLDEDPEARLERLTRIIGPAGGAERAEAVSVPGLAALRSGVEGRPTASRDTPPGSALLAPRSLALLQRQLHRADQQGDIWYNGHWFTPTVTLRGEALVIDTLRVTAIGVDTLLVESAEWQLRLAVDAEGTISGGGGRGAEGQPLRVVRLADRLAADGWLVDLGDYAAPAGAPWQTSAVSVPVGGGVTLGGTLTMPDGPAPHAAVLLLSGSGAQDRDGSTMLGYRPLRELADSLAAHGIASLRLDDRGVGASGGDYPSRTINELADDASRALRLLAALPGVDAEALGIVGHSEGALVAMQAVANGADAKTLVLLAAPSRPGRELVALQQRYGATRMVRDSAPDRQPALIEALLQGSSEAVEALRRDSRGFRALLGYDPRAAAKRVRVPALLLHGDQDTQVPVGQAAELAAVLRRGGADAAVERLPDVNHLFLADRSGDPAGYLLLPDRRLADGVVAAVVRWLQARLP